MKKPNIFVMLLCISFSYMVAMDEPRNSLICPTLNELDSFIINQSKPIYSDKKEVLDQSDFFHVQALERVGVNMDDIVHYRGNTFNGFSFICYKGKVVYVEDTSLGIFFSSAKNYKLVISDEKQKSDPIKSVSFNEKGNILAAINTNNIFVWEIEDNPKLLCKDNVKNTEKITNAFQLVSLNNTGNIVATVIQQNTKDPSANCYSYHISIFDIFTKNILYNIDLKSLCTQLYFINERQLVANVIFAKHIFDLEEGKKVIDTLTPTQITALQWIYRQYQQLQEKHKAKGVSYLITRINLTKDNEYYKTISTLPAIVKKWAKTMVSIEGEKEECVIS